MPKVAGPDGPLGFCSIPQCRSGEAPEQQLTEKCELQLREGAASLQLCKAGSYTMADVKGGLMEDRMEHRGVLNPASLHTYS